MPVGVGSHVKVLGYDGDFEGKIIKMEDTNAIVAIKLSPSITRKYFHGVSALAGTDSISLRFPINLLKLIERDLSLEQQAELRILKEKTELSIIDQYRLSDYED